MRFAAHCLSVALMLAFTLDATAGPLRERLAQRRAERLAAQEQRDGDRLDARRLSAAVKLKRDIAYGPHKEQVYDVYTPAGATRAPVIFMVHGGGWRRGDKGADAVVDNKVAHYTSRGYVLISVNYRMLPEADPLVQARDVAAALAAAQRTATDWGGDSSRFILMGHSAGAHLVSLIASSDALRGNAPYLGVVSLDSAAMDVEQLMQDRPLRLHKEAFGADPAFWRAASPYAQLSRAVQPMLAVCSTRREEACAQARRYADKAAQLGTRIEVLPKDMSHRDINETLGEAGAYTDAVDRFINTLSGR